MPSHNSEKPAPPVQPFHPDPRLNALCKKHQVFLEKLLSRQKDIKAASRKDLAQEVLLVFARQVEAEGEPADVEGYLAEVSRKKCANYRRLRRLQIAEGASLEAEASTERDPEGTAVLTELQRKMDRYVARLPEPLAEVIRCVCLGELSLKQTAELLGRPLGTVTTQYHTAKDMLDELARASERATQEGAQARPGTPERAPRRPRK